MLQGVYLSTLQFQTIFFTHDNCSLSWVGTPPAATGGVLLILIETL